MIKHPAFRVANVIDIQPAALAILYDDLSQWAAQLPCAALIVDFEIVGSYARGVAELHSDLDINLATGTEVNRHEAIRLCRQNKVQLRKAVSRLTLARKKYGIRVDVALQDAAVKLMPQKCCYSLKEMRFYGTERRRMDIDYITKTVSERPIVRIRPPRLSLSVWDDALGEQVPFDPAVHDPWLDILPNYRRLYGPKLLEYGFTTETQNMRGG